MWIAGIPWKRTVATEHLSDMKPVEGRRRVVIEEVQPQVDCGRYPAKRILGDTVTVTAAVFGDGHDHVAARLLYRHSSETDWRSTPLTPLTNDLWTVTFTVDKLGDWLYTIEGWVDHFAHLVRRSAKTPHRATRPQPRPTPPTNRRTSRSPCVPARSFYPRPHNAPKAPTATSSLKPRPI